MRQFWSKMSSWKSRKRKKCRRWRTTWSTFAVWVSNARRWRSNSKRKTRHSNNRSKSCKAKPTVGVFVCSCLQSRIWYFLCYIFGNLVVAGEQNHEAREMLEQQGLDDIAQASATEQIAYLLVERARLLDELEAEQSRNCVETSEGPMTAEQLLVR